MKEILKEKTLQIPIVYENKSCEKAVDKVFEKYISTLVEYSVNSELIGSVRKFQKHVKDMYTQYYLGHQNRAYEEFKIAIQTLMNGNPLFYDVVPDDVFYRARVNENNLDYKNDEMFHIKYDLRGKVSTQRFSFPGLPCLYLGLSTYVCWQELNRPIFAEFQVAAIKRKNPNKTFKVIDLALHPISLYNQMNLGKKTCDINDYLRLWPIIAASSVVVKNEGDPFKPEYIFPQFMLQYLLEDISEEMIIGIKYISVKVGKISNKQYEDEPKLYMNYVFPIQSKKGFCEKLSQEFEIFRNYSGRELVVLTDSARETGMEWIDLDKPIQETNPLDAASLYDTNGCPYSYKNSIFRRMEIILNNENNNNYNADGKLIIKPISKEEIDNLFI